MDHFMISCCLCFCLTVGAQSPDYFQQEVTYDIKVQLDDTRHELEGTVRLVYTNHSPDTLGYLYFHLWANAYDRPPSDFSRQLLRHGNTKFHFAKDSELGGYRSVAFYQADSLLVVEPDPVHPDIVKVLLPSPLMPGDSVHLRIPFQLKIPASFSRLGHIGESYQMTQWYPKPAVYDRQGWHPMPYLDLGEYYSEFGSFDVAITLPENYVVGATGVLQDSSERNWLLAKTLQGPPASDDFPASSKTLKTLHYHADQVHDFAWFADKRFQVRMDTVVLPTGQSIETWAMYTLEEADLWTNALHYLERSLRFYSELVGPYPYPQMTAVYSGLSAGGGMEYPMITVLNRSYDAEYLDETITHEVGHNWFYGILGFNERTDPWLDEGLNTYYEYRYSAEYYYQDRMDVPEEYYLALARQRRDQPADTHSDSLSEPNYWLAAYDKPAMAFRYLEGWLGQAEFDRHMQAFFTAWQFKHPQASDVRAFWEQASGQDLSWLFDGVIGTTDHLDYAVQSIQEKGDQLLVSINNKGKIAGPFALSGMKKGSPEQTIWYPGIDTAAVLSFPRGDYDWVVLDQGRFLPEFNRKDNQIRTKGPFKKVEPLNLVVRFDQGDALKTNVYLLPAILWNNYDKGMIGFVLFNHWQVEKPLEFELLPTLSLVTGKLAGLGSVRYHWYPDARWVHRIRLGLSAKQFHYDYNWENKYYLQYRRLVPGLELTLPSAPTSAFRQTIEYRAFMLGEEQARFDTAGIYTDNDWNSSLIHRLDYRGRNTRALHPFSYRVGLEQQAYTNFFGGKEQYLKLELQWKGAYTYRSERSLHYRLFAGFFLENTRREAGGIFPGAFNLTGQGYQGHDDYAYQEYYLGRNENQSLLAQQITVRDGGFKNAFGAPFQAQSGNSNSYLLACNLQADLPQDLPGNLPVKPYFDLAFSRDARPTATEKTVADQVWWSGGFCLDFADGILAVYFPVVHSKNLRDLYAQDGKSGYFSTVTFQFDLNRLNWFRP